MDERKNCWEFFQCGREPGGIRIMQLGVCPAAVQDESDGINHGRVAGRFCWNVEGTLCLGTVHEKFKKCLECPFFAEVERQEGRLFILRRKSFLEQLVE